MNFFRGFKEDFNFFFKFNDKVWFVEIIELLNGFEENNLKIVIYIFGLVLFVWNIEIDGLIVVMSWYI